jgi:hypothetical protein
LGALVLFFIAPARAADLIAFWDEPRYGANSMNAGPPDAAYFEALAGYGASWVRLAYDKWEGEGRDFLLGSADDYDGLVEADLAALIAALDCEGLHWAFYAFREDAWDGMDYELGDAPLPWRYWEAVERGEDYPLTRGPTPQFKPIRARLEAGARGAGK